MKDFFPRVRDEIRMTISAYQTLYESSIAFGMRKSLMAEQRRILQQKKVKMLHSSCSELEKDVEGLKTGILEIENREKKRRREDNEKHEAEVGS